MDRLVAYTCARRPVATQPGLREARQVASNISNFYQHRLTCMPVVGHIPGGGTPYTEVYMYVPRKCPCFWPFFSLSEEKN